VNWWVALGRGLEWKGVSQSQLPVNNLAICVSSLFAVLSVNVVQIFVKCQLNLGFFSINKSFIG